MNPQREIHDRRATGDTLVQRERADNGHPQAPTAPAHTHSPDSVANQALDYGVTVERAHVQAGELYWRVCSVRHLSPAENRGRHHIYIMAKDRDGKRAINSQVQVKWDGGSEVLAVNQSSG